MNNSLEPLKASALTSMEFGQLMKSHLSELSAIDQELITDQPYKVELLNIGRYIARMKNSNENFKNLFKGRTVTTAFTESYDLKTIRIELLAIYNEFTAYVLSMAKAHKTPLFISALALLNTTRKYYADLLARRSTGKPTPPAA